MRDTSSFAVSKSIVSAIVPASVVGTGLLLPFPVMAETEIRQVVPVSPGQRQSIRKAAAQDPEIERAIATLRRDADALLEAQPRPLREIFYQGLLDTDPRRAATEKSLADLDKLAALGEVFAATGDSKYGVKAREFVLAWVRAYVPNGNSINENKLEPVFLAYDLLRETFSADEKRDIEAWLRKAAQKQIETNGWRDPEHSKRSLENWDSKRFKIVGVIGWILQEPAWVDYGLAGFKEYVARGLYADGTSEDLKTRDALSYHVSGLRPLLVMALWAEMKTPGEGKGLFDYVAPNGASLRKSVEYVLPFARGEKIHEEWKNTTVELDRQRAAAGIAYYQPGKPYDPLSSLEMFEMASAFDTKFAPLVAQLQHKQAEQHADETGGHWLSLVVRLLHGDSHKKKTDPEKEDR